jgi:hypothetical protein
MPDEPGSKDGGTALLRAIVPQEFHEKGYLKDLLDKPQTEAIPLIFKKLDGAESLVGKKTVVPGPDAKDEDWDKYLAQLRPGKAEEYEIPLKEGAKPDEEFMKELRESFLAGDISKRQATKFLGRFNQALEKRTAALADAQKKADLEFETLVKAAFGDQGKAAMERTKKMIESYAPAPVKPYIGKLDNNALAIIMGISEGILKKYAPEDELNTGNRDGGDNGKSLREQARALNEEISKMNPMDPGIDQKRAQLKQLYKQAAAAGA